MANRQGSPSCSEFGVRSSEFVLPTTNFALRTKRSLRLFSALAGLLLAAGCQGPSRMATRVKDVPRIDLSLEGGNRGYLVGTPPAGTGSGKTTRQMVETDVELPTFYAPKSGAKPGFDQMAPPEIEQEEPQGGSAGAQQPPARYETYVVQPGESLWSIAAKPEIYGKATRWRRIFDANRDLLKSPDRLKAGMTLRIPREDGADELPGDEGSTYTK